MTCTLRGQRRLSPDEVSRYLFRKVVSWGRSSNVFLENGSRLYLDVGSHPEYATAECDSIYDVVVQDKAGERILENLVGSAEERLREEGIRGTIYLFKNNTDSAGNSYGCHENYLTSREDDSSLHNSVLIPFLVSRMISPEPERSFRRPAVRSIRSHNAPTTFGKRCLRRLLAVAPSLTLATNLMLMPKGTAAFMSLSVTQT